MTLIKKHRYSNSHVIIKRIAISYKWKPS